MGKRLYTLYLKPRRSRRVAAAVYWTGGTVVLAALVWVLFSDSGVSDSATVPLPARAVDRSGPSATKSPLAGSPAPSTRASAAPANSPHASPRANARSGTRPVRDTAEAQIALDRLGISSGAIDGMPGSQTRRALEVFQREMNLPASGQLDATTRAALPIAEPVLAGFTVTAEDIASLRPLGATWLAKSQQDRLGYETLLELVAERTHAHPRFLRRLNPSLDWSNLTAGASVLAPRIGELPPARAARVRIQLGSRVLEAFDERGVLLAHFPCSIAQRVDKRPVGGLRVAVVVPDPNYTFDPAIFSESPEAREVGRKLILPPGPNNPVGTAWIGLDRAGYGIHGTPGPEAVGRTESHGCFRLANWNARRLLKLVWVGMPVVVEP